MLTKWYCVHCLVLGIIPDLLDSCYPNPWKATHYSLRKNIHNLLFKDECEERMASNITIDRSLDISLNNALLNKGLAVVSHVGRVTPLILGVTLNGAKSGLPHR